LQAIRKGGRTACPHGVEQEPKAPSCRLLLDYDSTPGAAALDRLNELIGDGPFHVGLRARGGGAGAPREENHHQGKRTLRIH